MQRHHVTPRALHRCIAPGPGLKAADAGVQSLTTTGVAPLMICLVFFSQVAQGLRMSHAATDIHILAAVAPKHMRPLWTACLPLKCICLCHIVSCYVATALRDPCGCGLPCTRRQASRSVRAGIFIISGLGLRRGEAARALSAWGAILFGFASILFVTPLAALAVQRLPLGSPELTLGLAVFCCMPTTLSSGVSLTQVTPASAPELLMRPVTSALALPERLRSVLHCYIPAHDLHLHSALRLWSLTANRGSTGRYASAQPRWRQRAHAAQPQGGRQLWLKAGSEHYPGRRQIHHALYAVPAAHHGQPGSFLPPGALSSGCCRSLACGRAGIV